MSGNKKVTRISPLPSITSLHPRFALARHHVSFRAKTSKQRTAAASHPLMDTNSTKTPRTPAQAAASRANGAKSTGPRDTSLSRFNSLKHGYYAKSACLSAEDPAAIQLALDHLIEIHSHDNHLELIRRQQSRARRDLEAAFRQFLLLRKQSLKKVRSEPENLTLTPEKESPES